MQNNATISIIIPVYNRQELVKETLDSVLGQTYQNWECIVVDDGSTDETWKVLEEYANKDSRIKIHKRHREPKGAPTCRNIGVELSEGEYLVFWDSDDIMAPWCIRDRVSFMEENKMLDFALFQLLNVHNNKASLLIDMNEREPLIGFLSLSYNWGTLSLIWRKAYFFQTGGWNEMAKIWQDPELYIRTLLGNPNYRIGSLIPDGIVRCSIDKNSISDGNGIRVSLLNRLDVMASIVQLLSSDHLTLFKKAIENTIWLKTYNLSIEDKLFIINYAYNLNLVNKKVVFIYKTTFLLYSCLNKIPLVKGLYYRTFIKLRFNKSTLDGGKKFEDDIKIKFLEKTNDLDQDVIFKILINKVINE